MLKHRYIDLICISAAALAVVITLLFMNGTGIAAVSAVPLYAGKLFDDSYVHTIDIQMENWQEFIETAPEETYSACDVTIDGEIFRNIGIRAKGNNSKRLTEEYGLSRYSLKLEFDHFTDTTYFGLDKFSLDSSFQDNSYMKTYLVYDMMEHMGVVTPLCSFVNVTVNSESWGLFLAVEEPEESFARRNYGDDHGRLYKPDYKNLGDENADVDLRYTGDDFENYDNIFRTAKFDISDEDKIRLINSLKVLDSGQNIGTVADAESLTSYFAVQVFSMNFDSYIGPTGHNYFLYEKDGLLSMLPWDYNLSFGTYCYGMSNPIRDAETIINYPVNTPWKGEDMLKRPLFHNLMKNSEYFDMYHEKLDKLLTEYFENGRFEVKLRQTMAMISPYVKSDATAFCTFEDYLTGCETLIEVCRKRAESIRGQLEGVYPITIAKQREMSARVDCSHIDIRELGDFDDLENARQRNDAALAGIS